MEECAEVQQIASKSLRFGLDNHHPDGTETNRERLCKEIRHIDAVVTSLYDEGALIDGCAYPGEIAKKLERMEHYMGVSEKCGILEPGGV
jgi:hypothetical protein